MNKKLEEEIFLKLKKNLTEVVNISQSEITKNSTLENDLNMDSFDRYEALFRIEDDFDMEIPDEDAATITTVKDYINYILIKKYNKQ